MISYLRKYVSNIIPLIFLVQIFSCLLFTNTLISYKYLFSLNAILLFFFFVTNKIIEKKNLYFFFLNFFFIINFDNFNNYTIANLFFLNILFFWNSKQIKINYEKKYIYYYFIILFLLILLFFIFVPFKEIGYFRYSILNLDVNIFSIICLSILSCLFYSKNFNIKLIHLYFSIIIVLLTQSRVAVIYVIFQYLILFTNIINFKRFCIIFALTLFLLFFLGHVFISFFPTIADLRNNNFLSFIFTDSFPRLLNIFDLSLIYKFFSNYFFIDFFINNFSKFIMIPNLQEITNNFTEDQLRDFHPHNSVLGLIKTMGIVYLFIFAFFILKHLKDNQTFFMLLLPNLMASIFLGSFFILLLNIFILRSSIFIKEIEDEIKQQK